MVFLVVSVVIRIIEDLSGIRKGEEQPADILRSIQCSPLRQTPERAYNGTPRTVSYICEKVRDV